MCNALIGDDATERDGCNLASAMLDRCGPILYSIGHDARCSDRSQFVVLCALRLTDGRSVAEGRRSQTCSSERMQGKAAIPRRSEFRYNIYSVGYYV